MTSYILRRLAATIPVLLGVTAVAFTLTYLLPGDPARALAGERYREEELEKMNRNFYGFDPSYHVARYNFVYKVPKSRTPLTIAHHRRREAIQRAS